MASITFGCDEKGEHQIYDRKEVFHKVGIFLGKMWNGFQSCGNCENCRNYFFVIKELEGVGFGKSSIVNEGIRVNKKDSIFIRIKNI